MARPGRLISRVDSYEAILALAAAGMALLLMLTMLAATGGRPVAPLDDAYIHFQYARQLALGQPWQYNAGEALSTGATSLLYPFLLSVAYLAGFQGETIVWPALIIGAAALIISTVVVFRLTISLSSPVLKIFSKQSQQRMAFIIALGFLLSGAVHWAFLNGMETGLFTMFVLLSLSAMVAGRTKGLAIFLVLAAWVRPEGLFLAAIAWLIFAAGSYDKQKIISRDTALMTLAVLLSALPFIINFLLTGTPVATGAQAKSWLGNVPFVPLRLAGNIGRMWLLIVERLTVGFLASRTWPAPPGLLILVFIGAVAGWAGNRRTVILLAGWFVAGTLAAASLITALWQVGRYQAPVMAMLWPLAGVGLIFLVDRGWRRHRNGILLVLVAWSAVVLISAVQSWRAYDEAVASIAGQQVALAEWVDSQLPYDAIVAVHDAGAIRYLGRRTIYDLLGLTTQGAATAWRHGSGAVFESLGAASPRPEFFATYPDVATIPYFADTDLFSETLFETEAHGLRTAGTAGQLQRVYRADWRKAAGSDEPRQADTLALVSDLDLVWQLDAADLEDEDDKGFSWTVGRTAPGFPTEVRQFSYQVDPQIELIDGGRLISGSASFPAIVEPGTPLILVARLHAPEAGAVNVQVNGRDAGLWRYPAAPGRWLESTYLIPPDLIQDPQVEVELKLVDPAGTALPWQLYYLWAFQGTPHREAAMPQQELGYRFADDIILEGVDLSTQTMAPGETLPLVLYWRAEHALDLDAKLFVHLYDELGQLVAQVDQRSYHDTRPPFTWLPGQTIVDPVSLTIPDDLAPGVYQLAMGLYEPQTNERLAVTGPGDAILSAERLWLSEIVVSR